jgi:phosphoglycerol transferase MdoB-like AlkP superfamily enzyme
MTLPLAVSIIISILAAVQVARELQWWGERGEKAIVRRTAKDGERKLYGKRFGVVFGLGAGFCLAIYLLGFYISIPVFAFAYLKWRKRSWLVAAIFAVAVLACSYAVFTLGLKVPLYQGLVFGAH